MRSSETPFNNLSLFNVSGINISHLKKKKKRIPKTNKILVCGDILWGDVRVPSVAQPLVLFQVFPQECGILRLTAKLDQNYRLHVRFACVFPPPP